MNILFLSLGQYDSINESGIYTDLLREFTNRGDNVYVLSPTSSRKNKTIKEKNSTIIKVYTGPIQKTNIIQKGINTLLIENRFKNCIKRNLNKVSFDLVLYPTPPITFAGVVKFVKKRDNAKTYLLLKDIFPQNAVDIGMMKKNGFIYNYFRNKEKNLYKTSDFIGCMSQGNVDYLLNNNQYIERVKVEICPNTITTNKNNKSVLNMDILKKYQIPQNAITLIYGGNLGKPQGINYLGNCILEMKDNKEFFFIIVGSGTEYNSLEKFIHENNLKNVRLINKLPKSEYDSLVEYSDVGLIFLDSRFTIPNIPSRLLSYLEQKKPVLAMTDANTDLNEIIAAGKFGWWGESNNVRNFISIISTINKNELTMMGQNGYQYLLNHYTSDKAYKIIMNRVNGKD